MNRRKSFRTGSSWKCNGCRVVEPRSCLGRRDDVSKVLAEFDALDLNSDGVLTKEEFLAGRASAKDPDDRLERFRRFLIESEELGPSWYKLTDTFLTALGTICFVTSVVQPGTASSYHLTEVEDVINVSFFVKFVLLFWINDFDVPWLFSGKGALDLASCLPVLDIPARLWGGPTLARTTDLLQIGRFLRLLREALPSDMDAVRAGTARKVPLGQQIFAVVLSLFGTVVVSATVLFSYENPLDQEMTERSFEDALVYMVNIFAGRDPPWYPSNSKAKLASVAATICGLIFIPFLISRTVEILMAPFTSTQAQPIDTGDVDVEWIFADWVTVLQRLDMLDEAGLISPGEAKKLRKLCFGKSDSIKMLDLCYGKACSSLPRDMTACQLYASRLRE